MLRVAADDQLLHVEVGGVQQAPFVRRGEHGQRVVIARAAQIRAFERIDRDIHLRQRPVLPAVGAPLPHLLADIQHRRLVALAFADDDGAVDRDGIERAPHGADSRFVGLVAIALAHGVASADRRLFDDAEEFEREVGIHTC